MAQLTYQQAKALKAKIVAVLTDKAEKNIKERQSKYDNDPAHKELRQLTNQIEALQGKRRVVLNGLKKRNDISTYIGESSSREFRFKDGNLISGETQTAIMDDLTIFTIGSDNGKANPQNIIDTFVKKYSAKL